jgi:hypothetical protein
MQTKTTELLPLKPAKKPLQIAGSWLASSYISSALWAMSAAITRREALVNWARQSRKRVLRTNQGSCSPSLDLSAVSVELLGPEQGVTVAIAGQHQFRRD